MHNPNQNPPIAQPRARAAFRGPRPQSESFQRTPASGRRPRSQVITPSTNVFINYIPPRFTEQDLRNLCSQYGEIISSKIMINLETGQSKCFGFVKFRELSQAHAAIQAIDGMSIGNKRLLAKYAESQEKHEKLSTMLYIKHLPLSIDVNGVYQIFSRFGEITQVSPHSVDSTDPQYWRCFVRYQTQEAATEAMSMNNQIIVEGSRPIHVKYADEARLSGSFVLPPTGSTPSAPTEDEQRKLLPSFFFN
ncbi:hypothetical protein TVAG_267990 [Trichomonas vaginalis G3]|uniref:RRM domain-containing protein n=1 Tax=Trichomonas vaginalis (strain ATCC PRA-98 / G3) TaxID=412133 RepID=A2DLE8_TRIV3|nr:RNA binding [Trichomonas vaginalis G3]EAY18766.1 hypothetical protein TVAG_267990 [Trichomonas vaginalis G3]KAI5539298.1 RNA binding [Trichomonas vaginalis G3]|eukprot:XP_001579752.1 hypothetical protein [Trichomonas vaginalis G3]